MRGRAGYRPVRPLQMGVLGILVVALLIISALTDPKPQATALPPGEYRVVRVVDGDTLLLEGDRRVRLLGVDTPETKKADTPVEPFGPEAYEFTREVCEGRMVRIEVDREPTDQYGRFLAYVYIEDLFLNAELIRRGLSSAQLQYPYRVEMKRVFQAAEKSARQRRIGVWSLPSSMKP